MESRRLPVALLGLFIVLSFCDLVLTWLVISKSNGEIIESNPIAAVWLRRFGWQGLIIFKAAAMSVVIAVTILLNPRRPILARVTLGACCALMMVVAFYSYHLLQRFW
jgi:uncharacterized membrane protein